VLEEPDAAHGAEMGVRLDRGLATGALALPELRSALLAEHRSVDVPRPAHRAFHRASSRCCFPGDCFLQPAGPCLPLYRFCQGVPSCANPMPSVHPWEPLRPAGAAVFAGLIWRTKENELLSTGITYPSGQLFLSNSNSLRRAVPRMCLNYCGSARRSRPFQWECSGDHICR